MGLTYYVSTMIGRVKFMYHTMSPTIALMMCCYAIYRVRPLDSITGSIADETIGYIFCFLSMVEDTSYTVILNYVNDPLNIEEHRLDDGAFLAAQSLSTLVSGPPLMLLSRYLGFETFELPGINISVQLFVMVFIFIPILTYAHYKLFLLMSPLIVQMTFTAIGPMSALVDYFLGLHNYPFYYIITLVLMLVICLICATVIEKDRGKIVEANKKRHQKLPDLQQFLLTN